MYQLFGSSLIVTLNCNLGLDLDCYVHFWPDLMLFSARELPFIYYYKGAADFCRLVSFGAGSPLLHRSDHELSSIINQRAPERPSLGRGQLET